MKKIIRFSFLLVLVLLLNGCDDFNEVVDSITDSGDDNSAPAEELASVVPQAEQQPAAEAVKEEAPKAEADEKAAEDEPESAEYETRFHHTTTGSSDGGKSLVLCDGQRMDFDRCSSNGTSIPYHGHDKGRVSYWNMREEPSGDIVCTKDGQTYRYRADRTVVYGSCP
ncbi:hypothetical protein VU01_10036 [Candidatus Electrothrix marina]|uniref:Uncharacterized protein n=1 Tax=Candidatus Electrothrix marina TaxID=1859130 RepID=A0A444JHF2_9BACT|nr:hypothetical protein VU01_10036 [Candidatus Electrothrix marina]